MWVCFFLCCAAMLFLLYAPGTLASKAIGLSPLEVITLSPLVSIAMYAALGVLFDGLGLRGVGSVITGSFVCSLALLALLLVRRCGRKGCSIRDGMSGTIVAELVVSVCVCSIAMAYLYLKVIDGADSFLECSDNAFHLNAIKAMLNGGSLSVLHVSQYSAMTHASQAPYSIEGSFYPAGWHILVAIACGLVGAPATVGENAGAFVFSGVVFPAGMTVLLKSVFPGKSGVAAVGSIAFCSCAAFPLAPLDVHQIYPNFAALCTLPGLMSFFASRMDEAWRKTDFLKMTALLLAPLLGCAILHPNVVIAFFVMAASLLVFYPWKHFFSGGETLFPRHILIPFAVTIVFVCGWVVSIDTPVFSGVTSYLWDWTVSPLDALGRTLSFGFVLGIPQPVFAVFVALGFFLCAKERRSRWLCLALVVFLVIFFFNACGSPGIKKEFAGYWYTDPERTAALAVLAAVPCAAVGLYALVDRSRLKLLAVLRKGKGSYCLSIAISCGILIAFGVLAYMPCFPFTDSQTAVGYRRYELHESSAVAQRAVFTKDEKEFCDKAKAIVGDDLVLNVPQDGSMFSYSICGLNVYYKSFVSSEDSSDSQILRTQIADFSNNDKVRAAAIAAGVKYIVLLDRGDEGKVDFNLWGDLNDRGFEGYKGLDASNSFRLILEDETRKLYEIIY